MFSSFLLPPILHLSALCFPTLLLNASISGRLEIIPPAMALEQVAVTRTYVPYRFKDALRDSCFYDRERSRENCIGYRYFPPHQHQIVSLELSIVVFIRRSEFFTRLLCISCCTIVLKLSSRQMEVSSSSRSAGRDETPSIEAKSGNSRHLKWWATAASRQGFRSPWNVRRVRINYLMFQLARSAEPSASVWWGAENTEEIPCFLDHSSDLELQKAYPLSDLIFTFLNVSQLRSTTTTFASSFPARAVTLLIHSSADRKKARALFSPSSFICNSAKFKCAIWKGT